MSATQPFLVSSRNASSSLCSRLALAARLWKCDRFFLRYVHIRFLDFRLFTAVHTRSNQFKNQIFEKDIKSKYPEEYSTVDKVGIEKLLSEEIQFRVELIVS